MAKVQTVDRVPMGDFEENGEGELVVRQFEREIAEADIIDDAFSRIRALCGASTSPVKLALYRCVPNSRKENYICDLETADFSPEVIKSRFGGGEFTVKAYNEKSKLTLNQRLCIEGDPVIAAPPLPGAHVAPALDVTALIAGMQESNRTMLAGLAQMLQPQQNSEIQVLEKMAMYKNLFAQPQQPQANSLDMFMKGLEFAREVIPKNGGAETTGMDVMLEAVKGFAPALGELTHKINAQSAVASTAALQNPGIQPQSQLQNEDAMLKMYLTMLVNYAKAGKDPQLYAELIADNLNDDQLSQLLSENDLMAKLISMNGDIANYRPWFESVIKEMREIVSLTEPESGSNVSENNSLVAGSNANIGSAKNADGSAITGNQ